MGCYIGVGQELGKGKTMRDIYNEITSETCEDCEGVTYFTLKQLSVTMDLVTIQGGVIDYEGTWVCSCGQENSSVGQVSL